MFARQHAADGARRRRLSWLNEHFEANREIELLASCCANQAAKRCWPPELKRHWVNFYFVYFAAASCCLSERTFSCARCTFSCA